MPPKLKEPKIKRVEHAALEMKKINHIITENVERKRIEKGLNSSELAALIGVSPTQMRQYATGVDRISAARLWVIADALGVPVGSFFEKNF